jgi:hypothetical protein
MGAIDCKANTGFAPTGRSARQVRDAIRTQCTPTEAEGKAQACGLRRSAVML